MKQNQPSSMQDLMRALHRLSPTDEGTHLAIGRVLGFGLDGDSDGLSANAAQTSRTPAREVNPPRSPRRRREAQPPKPDHHPEKSLDFTITEVATSTPRTPEWVTNEGESIALPLAKDEQHLAPPAIQPLFRPIWERSILATLFANYEYRGGMDVTKVVDQLSRGKVITSLPRLPVPTLAKGVQLLVDRSAGMLPFQEDLKQILKSIRRLMGGYALQVLRFSAAPMRAAGKGSPFTWTPYEDDWLPPRGTSVICLTDLGIGRPPGPDTPAAPGEWLAFQALLRRHGCSLAVITPYKAERWPAQLRDALDIVHWDDEVHIAAVKRIVRD